MNAMGEWYRMLACLTSGVGSHVIHHWIAHVLGYACPYLVVIMIWVTMAAGRELGK